MVIISILSVLTWIFISMLVYAMIITIYEETDFFKILDKLKIRTRNILIRILVLLGPIGFAITLISFVLYIVYSFIKFLYEWIIDIDDFYI